MAKRRNTPMDVWRLIDKRSPAECWRWRGTVIKASGYGVIGIARSDYLVHRVVYALENPGVIELRAPKDKSRAQFVLHQCDNRLCCNPAHLFLGNYADNNRDAAIKGRTSRNHGVKGTRNYAAKLSAQQVKEIREKSAAGLSNGQLEAMYPVSNEAIRRVVNGMSYREI